MFAASVGILELLAWRPTVSLDRKEYDAVDITSIAGFDVSGCPNSKHETAIILANSSGGLTAVLLDRLLLDAEGRGCGCSSISVTRCFLQHGVAKQI